MNFSLDDFPAGAFYLLISVFCLFAYMLLRAVFEELNKARFIEDTPTSKVRSAPQGYVELEGVADVIPSFKQVAPLSGKVCCWYSYMIEELVKVRRTNGQVDSRWQTLVKGASPHLFALNDGTGSCVLSPIGSEVITAHSENWEARSLPRHLQRRAPSGKKQYRFYEDRIEPGDPLYVLGHFETIQNIPELHHEQEFASQKKNNNGAFFGPGKAFFFMPARQEVQTINNEWAQYQEAHQQSDKHTENVHLMRSHPGGRQPYILSNLSQKRLARKYRWKAFGYSLFFLLVTSLGFLMTLGYFDLISFSQWSPRILS